MPRLPAHLWSKARQVIVATVGVFVAAFVAYLVPHLASGGFTFTKWSMLKGVIIAAALAGGVAAYHYLTGLVPAQQKVAKTHKYGRLPAYRPPNLKDFIAYVAGKLPTAPPAAHWGHWVLTHGGFNMDGNDTYGDCTIAGAAHAVQVWNHEVGKDDLVPSSAACVKQYFLLEGSPNGAVNPNLDNGLVMANVLKAWKTGLFNSTAKIAAYAPVNKLDVATIKQCIAYYGAAYLGVNLPQSAEQQFPNPWTVVPGSQIAGGHCITGVGYDEEWCYVVSWGTIVACSWQWITTYTEECWAVIPDEFLQAGRGPLKAEDLAQLQADLATV